MTNYAKKRQRQSGRQQQKPFDPSAVFARFEKEYKNFQRWKTEEETLLSHALPEINFDNKPIYSSWDKVDKERGGKNEH